jgi:hypothetical protein
LPTRPQSVKLLTTTIARLQNKAAANILNCLEFSNFSVRKALALDTVQGIKYVPTISDVWSSMRVTAHPYPHQHALTCTASSSLRSEAVRCSQSELFRPLAPRSAPNSASNCALERQGRQAARAGRVRQVHSSFATNTRQPLCRGTYYMTGSGCSAIAGIVCINVQRHVRCVQLCMVPQRAAGQHKCVTQCGRREYREHTGAPG